MSTMPPLAVMLQNLQKRRFQKKGSLLEFQAIESPVGGGVQKVGVLFSGGPASGGHNVIVGLLQALKTLHPKSTLVGFLGGPGGLVGGQSIDLTEEVVMPYLNRGGFDLLGSGRTKIETPEQFASIAKVIRTHSLDGIVFIGGDDTATNAYQLSRYLQEQQIKTTIVACPKTIDGDLRTKDLELSFGFDTATKVYSEMIGNLCIDGRSSRKYWHFVKLMGRSASHVTLECALQTQPNLALIGEEVAHRKDSIHDIVRQMADVMEARYRAQKNYGVILIPEGLLEFVPEMKGLIEELNTLLAKKQSVDALSSHHLELFQELPEDIKGQLLAKRDAHGNVALSQIETEKFFAALVIQELQKRNAKMAEALVPVFHFYGYEGRCSVPSIFDRTYCFNLGYIAALLVRDQITGTMAAIRGLCKASDTWQGLGIDLAGMVHQEERNGVMKEVIAKALVDLKGGAFTLFSAKRGEWQVEDCYQSPGPMQVVNDEALQVPLTLQKNAPICK